MTVRDLGYRAYEGELLPHRSRYTVLMARTLAQAWSVGLVKATLILGAFPAVVCGAVMILKLKTMQFLSAQGAPIQLEDPGNLVFTCIYWCQIWFAFDISLLVAVPSVAEDVRTGAFQFYFARPVSRNHYLVGKVVPVVCLVAVVSMGPALLLSLLRIGLSRTGAEAWGNMSWLLGTLAYGPIYALVLSLPAVALSSLGRRSGMLQGLWGLGLVVSWILGEGIASGADAPHAALVSVPTNLRLVGQLIYGLEPAHDLPWYLPAAVLAALVGGSAVVLLKRLQRVEVFS